MRRVLFASCWDRVAVVGVASAQTGMGVAELAKYSRADREQRLYDGAKKEGKVVWYTSLVPSKDIAKIFEAKYPGVTVEVYRAGGIELLSKALAEHKARRFVVDTIESTPGALMSRPDEQCFAPYTSPHLKAFPDSAKEKANNGLVYWTTDRESYIGFAYNKVDLANATPLVVMGLIVGFDLHIEAVIGGVVTIEARSTAESSP